MTATNDQYVASNHPPILPVFKTGEGPVCCRRCPVRCRIGKNRTGFLVSRQCRALYPDDDGRRARDQALLYAGSKFYITRPVN